MDSFIESFWNKMKISIGDKKFKVIDSAWAALNLSSYDKRNGIIIPLRRGTFKLKKWRDFLDSEVVQYEIEFNKTKKRHGKAVFYDSTGEIIRITNYKRGKKHGEEIEYWNGIVVRRSEYYNGILTNEKIN